MYISVRLDAKSVQIRDISKRATIKELRRRIADAMPEAPVDRQRLFFRGKLLVDEHTLFDYGVQINDVVQLMLTPADVVAKGDNNDQAKETKAEEDDEEASASVAAASSEEFEHDADCLAGSLYEPGDCVDVRDPTMGCWFEARVLKARRRLDADVDEVSVAPPGPLAELEAAGADDACVYLVAFEDDPELQIAAFPRNLRPRTRQPVSVAKLQPGQLVLCNYNYDKPGTIGYWYDAIVDRVESASGEARATVFVGPQLVPVADYRLRSHQDLPVYPTTRPSSTDAPKAWRATVSFASSSSSTTGGGDADLRPTPASCQHCRDKPNRRCRHCGCGVCAGKSDQDRLLLCDECDRAFHTYCLTPPLESVPEDDWYCSECKRDTSVVVRAGERLKASSKRRSSKAAKAAAEKENRDGEGADADVGGGGGGGKRDWGKGFACSGRTKTCTLVPVNHFGPIPSVEVGQSWLFRLQVSEAGVHRPPVSGIAGRDQEGAYSIVLSGGYEDDVDNGEEFHYTGSGGRDLSGNRRTAAQSCDQELTRMNRALARNVAAPIDDANGADAGPRWRDGKPVRVVRNYKAAKHSKYAPSVGNRYDGIYKVVKYWPHVGKSGFRVWRYLMRRDDPVPAPWTPAGRRRIESLGLRMELPEGYDPDAVPAAAAAASATSSSSSTSAEKKGKRGRKRKTAGADAGVGDDDDDNHDDKEASKRPCRYKPDAELTAAIEADALNAQIWREALDTATSGDGGGGGIQAFRAAVQRLFTCVVCCDLASDRPVTTPCRHNACQDCLRRSLLAGLAACPVCRAALSADQLSVNERLARALALVFPGLA